MLLTVLLTDPLAKPGSARHKMAQQSAESASVMGFLGTSRHKVGRHRTNPTFGTSAMENRAVFARFFCVFPPIFPTGP